MSAPQEETNTPASDVDAKQITKSASLYRRLYRRTVLILSVLFLIGVLSAMGHLLDLTSSLVESSMMHNATRYSEALAEFRTLYTSEVVARVRDKNIAVVHDYEDHQGAIPLPATMSIALGERMNKKDTGMQVRLYSPYPFPWREETGGLKDEFSEAAWQFLQQHPEQSFFRFEEMQSQRMLRYATADTLRAECVQCHNTYPDTPKADWRVGDMRGILEVSLPVGRIEEETNAELRSTFILIVGMALLGLTGLGLVIVQFRRNSADLERQVQERTVDLEQTNEQLQAEIAERKQAEEALQRGRDELEQTVADRTVELRSEIAERKQAEAALRASEVRFRSFSQATFEGIVISAGGVVVEANNQFAEMFGYLPDELDGMSVYTFAAPENVELVRQHISSDSEALYTSLGLRKDGTTFPIEIRARMTMGEEGELRVTAIRDITDRRALEDQLRQSQKMEAVGQLTAGVAHNFNNKLQGILMNLELAVFNREDLTTLEHAKTAVLQATEIVSQLMAFSRSSGAVSFASMRIDEVLDDVLEMGRETFDPKIELIADIPVDLPAITGGKGQLEQVFLNFLINARDAVQESDQPSPAIRIKAQVIPSADLPASPVSQGKNYIRVEVVDNGSGMDEETRQRIFEPFFTTKEVGKGTGLGLATAYGIINQHEGWIECESQPDNGTVFSVYLPVAEDEAVVDVPMAEAESPTDYIGGDETILLVEDDEGLVATLTSIFANRGYALLVAKDGEAGWDLFREERERIDVVLLDLSMPKMSGQELLRHIRSVDPAAKVIVSSGNMDIDIEPSQIQGLLRKPYTIAQVLQEIRQVLDEGA